MDKNVTVSVKGMLAIGLVLLALAVAYLLGDSGGTVAAQAVAPTSAAAGDEAADRRTVTMRGVGEVSVVPDQVGFDVAVRLQREDLETALTDANRVLARVLARLEALGVQQKDTETTGLDMNPVYDYPRDAPPVLRGYRVSQSVAVLVRDLKSAGRVISATIDEGGNAVRVSGIQLRVGDPGRTIGDAREAAVTAATDKAEQYAAATGQTLGEVVTIVEVDPERIASQVESSYRTAAYDEVAAAVLPIRTGRSDLSVTVQVVWELG